MLACSGIELVDNDLVEFHRVDLRGTTTMSRESILCVPRYLGSLE